MELNIKSFNRQDMLDLTKRLCKENPTMRELVDLAGIDCSDGVTSMDWEEKCYALEGYIEFLEEQMTKMVDSAREAMKCINELKSSLKE